MRTIDALLLAEQKLYTATPLTRVHLISADAGTTYTFRTDDSPTRIFAVTQREECWGGRARVQLKNTDHYFKTKNLRGYKVQIGWGYDCAAATDYSNAPDMWVIGQRDRSERGELITELLCIDLWNILARTMVAAGGTKLTYDTIEYTGNPMNEKLTQGTATGVIYYMDENEIRVCSVPDGESFTTGNATSPSITSMNITAAPLIGSGGGTLGWPADTDVKDIITSLLIGWADFTLDSDDPSGNADTYMPDYILPFGADIRSIIKDVLNFTECGLRCESDGVHMMYLDPSPVSADYEYKLDDASYHKFAEEVRNRYLVTPNRVYVISAVPAEGPVEYVSDPPGIDTDSYNALGSYLTRIVSMGTVDSNADANARASALINRYKAELNTGDVEVPLLNCAQELLDWVQITDARADGIAISGRVGMIERVYESGSGRFSMTIRLGGLSTNADVSPEGVDIPSEITIPARPVRKTDPPYLPPWSDILPKAIQGFQHDIVFVAVDQDTVSWSATNGIKFYDGTTQAIVNGSTGNLADTAIRYIYFNLADASPNVLKVTTDYQSVMTMQTGLVCLVQKASTAGMKATFIPSYGKEPLITPDFIDMTGLKEYTYGDGTKIQGIFSTQIQAGSIYLSAATSFATDYNPTEKFDLGDDSLDNVANGSTYHKLLATHIDAGKIKLTSASVKSGTWYNEYGITIDVATGILIDSGISTQSFRMVRNVSGLKYGYWYIDSDGDFGCYATSDLRLDANGYIYAHSSLLSNVAGGYLIGSSSKYFGAVHCTSVVDHSHMKMGYDNPLGLLKKMKNNVDSDKVDKESLPEDVLYRPSEADYAEAEIAYQKDLGRYHSTDLEDAAYDKMPIKEEPDVGIKLEGLIGLLISGMNKLTERIERLEGGA